jgi:HrpA-like RNA helicase
MEDFIKDAVSNYGVDHVTFTLDNLNNNVKTYKKTIDIVSNKLFVNWVNVLPLTLSNYTESTAWTLSQDYLTKVQPDNLFHGIHFYDVYNTLNRFLFQDIFHLKWLLYEAIIGKDARPTLYLHILDQYFPLKNLEVYDTFDDSPDKTKINLKWQMLQQEAALNTDEGNKRFHFLKSMIMHYIRRYRLPAVNNEKKDYLTFCKSVNLIQLYQYLHESLLEFNATWYGKSIKYIKPKWDTINVNGNIYHISYKVFYNFAKSICYREDVRIDVGHKLSESEITSVINDIKTKNVSFSGSIRSTYGKAFDSNISVLSSNINSFIRSNLIKIVFETHICHGLYSKFVPNKFLTDYSYVGEDFDERSAAIRKAVGKGIHKYDNAFYYLTNKPYNELVIYGTTALKYIINVSSWYSFYSMDWLFQINFYNHFINNRVLFVTGATGQGKSTQIPKLLHYGLRAFDLNTVPRVVSTQPRTLPTRDNAVFISKEMGVPNKQYSTAFEGEVNSFNTYVQYKSQTDSSLISNKGTYIREVTDGLLLENILNSDFVREDIIIVDEAHEHNPNMDLILSMSRDLLQSNMKLRLVITSATMDDDERIYRRYYREIQDVDPVLDRRVHLEPPFEPSRYSIQDVFMTRDPVDYAEAQELGIKKAIEVSSQIKGDILFFSIGKKDIMEICTELNEKLPSHVIALPFYRELPQEWKNIIPEISKNWDKIDFDKCQLTEVLSGEEVPRKRQKYSKAIIVSTNIAEASITIDSLTCVIDTGFYNRVYYDPVQRYSKLEVTPISDTSRVQRRGRVGRKSNGVVYYMYTENSKKQAKKKYPICDIDFTLSIYKLLGKYNMEKIMDPAGDFYIIHPCEDTIERDINGAIVSGTTEKMETFKSVGKAYELYDDAGRNTVYQVIINEMSNFQNDNESELQTLSYIRTLYFSVSFKCLNEVLFVFAMMRTKNFNKFFKLHPKTQSEIIQLYNLAKRFYKLLGKTKTTDTTTKNASEKYHQWKLEYLSKGRHTNVWDKIPLKKEEFSRIHDNKEDEDVPAYEYDDTELVRYIQTKSRVKTVSTFTQSFIKNMRILPIKCRKLRDNVGSALLDVQRSDNTEDNILKSFQMGFPLNIVNIEGKKAKSQGAEYAFTKEKHNITSPYGRFLYLTFNFDNEPDILSQIIS